MRDIKTRAALLVALALAFLSTASPPLVASTEPKGVFSTETKTVLAFSGGLQRMLFVDLDHSRVVQRSVDGAAFATTGADPSLGSIIVSNGESATALPVDGSAPIPLGIGQIAFAASGTADTWLVEFVDGTSVGPFRFRLVSPDGNVRAEVAPTSPELVPPFAYPVAAAGRMIAFESPSGLRLWDTMSGSVTIVGTTSVLVGQVSTSGRFLTWCAASCTELHVTDLANPRGFIVDEIVTSTPGRPLDLRSGALSPHGRYLAVVKGKAIGSISPQAEGDLVLVDLLRRTSTVIARGVPRSSSTTWSPDGRSLFFADYAYQGPTTALGRFDLDRRDVERVRIGLEGISNPIAVRSDAVAALLELPDGLSFDLDVSQRESEEHPSEGCFVTTRVSTGVGGAGGLYSGDPFASPGDVDDSALKVYLPSSGEPIAGSRPDGRFEFTFFFVGPTGQEEVEIDADRVGGPKSATFEISGRTAIVSKPGCWHVTGRVGDDQLTVTIFVRAAGHPGPEER